MHRSVIAVILFALLSPIAACKGAPRRQFVEWVARDSWDQGCAAQAIVEKFKTGEKGWNGDVYEVPVTATFKLVNPCQSKVSGKNYPQFQSVNFERKVKMVPCEADGKSGWAKKGKADERCWTEPKPPFVLKDDAIPVTDLAKKGAHLPKVPAPAVRAGANTAPGKSAPGNPAEGPKTPPPKTKKP